MMSALVLTTGCGSGPEYTMIQQYFRASQMRDNTTLGNIATVSFSPADQGTVTSFEVVSVAPEEKRPLRLKDLAAAEEAARQADDELNKKKKEYQDANLTAIERVLKAEQSGTPVRGADVAVQKSWTQWRDEASQSSKKLSDARQALSVERNLSAASLNDPRTAPVDATKFDGELVNKDVMVKAQVRGPDGATKERDLRIRMTRALLTSGPEGTPVEGRWIITQISEGPAAAPAT
jgi:hypothetical protein